VPSVDIGEQTLSVDTRDGAMRVFVARPEDAASASGVVMYMDAVGYREELRELARRVAREGYACWLPDLYHRDGGPSFDAYRPDRDFDRFAPLMGKLVRDVIVADTAALLAAMDADPAVAKGAKACIGFCMGGRFALWAAGAFPHEFAACASLHGGRLGTEAADSPHRYARDMRCELYLGFASDDPLVPKQHITTLERALDEARVPYESQVHAGTEHGYMFPQRYCHASAAAEKSWAKVFALFRRRLAPAGPVPQTVRKGAGEFS
jgi:carboxymethylenebutenolidase